MSEEWIERKVVQEIFSLTTKQFGRVMRNIKRKHECDYYLWIKRGKNKKTKMYVNQECVEWLKEVCFNKEEHYLTYKVRFYKRNKYVLYSLKFYLICLVKV